MPISFAATSTDPAGPRVVTDLQSDNLAPENLSPGRTLATARMARGMSVEDVAQRLKFAPRQIEALETDNHAALPGAPIVRGMIRGYARLLGLDAGALLGDLQRRVEPQSIMIAHSRMDVPFPTGPKKGGRLYLLLSLAVALAVAAVIADWLLRTREEAVEARVRAEAPKPPVAPQSTAVDVPATTATTVAATATAEPPTTPAQAALLASTGRLEFRFQRDSWIEVKDGEGTVIVSALQRAGTAQSVEGKPPFTLVVGNATGVRLRYNDADVDLAPHTRTDVARITLE
jgi:cytoskeleton protein RodZ